MLILLAARNFKKAMLRANVNDYLFTGLMGRELRNMTIGVLGTGYRYSGN
jgi:Lactate dehydrogenase and related dehydrogenases